MSDRARYWGGLVEAWERSGLSQVEFCRRRGLTYGTFAWWKGELHKSSGDVPARRGRPHQVPERFVEVRLPSVAPAYEVVLAGGRLIRIGAQFDPEVLTRLIAAVESC